MDKHKEKMIMNEAEIISDRKDEYKNLKENDDYFRSAFEQAVVGISQASLEGKFIKANKKFCDILGYTENELLNLNFKDITYSDDLNYDLNYVNKLLKGDIERFEMEKRYIKKDKSNVWVNLSVSLIKDSVGEPKFFIAVIKDVNEKKKSQEALKLSESRLKEVERIANVGYWEMEVATGKSCWSDGFFRICGIEPGTIKPTSEFGMSIIHPEDRDKAEKALEIAVKEEKPYVIEKRLLRVDGSVRTVLSKGEFIFDEDKNPLKLVGTIIDITEQKETEEKVKRLNEELEKRVEERTAQLKKAKESAERANHAKCNFIANISHELKTPLNIIMTYLEYLLEGQEGELNIEQKEILEIAYNNSERLEYLIRDLLDLSLLESQKVKFNYTKININEFIMTLINDRILMMKNKNLDIVVHVPEKDVSMITDTLRLRQVIDNLIDNAIKFSNGGYIEIEVKEKQSNIEIIIRDSGIGIEEDKINDVFEPFYQVDDTFTKKYKGVGLGLSIVKKIINAFGGEISVKNNVDKGCRFKMTIPYDCSAEEGQNEKNIYS